MRFSLTLGLLAALVAVPALAEARPRLYDRYQPGHDGLFLRFALGGGGVTADDDLNDVTLTGGAGLFSVDLGGAVAPSLALHGRLAISSMFEPNISSGGDNFGDLQDTSLTFTLLGAGATYYLPSNLYFSGVAGFSRASFEFYGDEYDALNGLGLIGDVGYEWSLPDYWGLGVGGRLEFHTVRNGDEQLSTAMLGVLVSLSYF